MNATTQHPDLSKLSLMPDMFEPGLNNVFLFDEIIGTVKSNYAGVPLEVTFNATPSGTNTSAIFTTSDAAYIHLIEVRNKSIRAKEVLTVSKNQTSLF